jgi:hypothetical protein
LAARALLALLVALMALGEGLAKPIRFHQMGSGFAAPVPASWEHLQQLEFRLAFHGVKVVHSSRCPKGLEGLYDHRIGQVLMCKNTMPAQAEIHWNTLAHEAVHVMQICRQSAPLSKGLDQLQQKMLDSTPAPEKLHILSAYPPEQRLYELEARWVANTFPPETVMALLDLSCGRPGRRQPTHTLLPQLMAKENG